MHVAGLRIRPGVENGDDRTAAPFLRRVAHLHRARAMAEGPEIVGREPARAAERFRTFLFWHLGTCARPEKSSHRRTIWSKPAFGPRYRASRFTRPVASR